MLPTGIDVKRLNSMVNYLRTDKIWAERHSYSIRIMYDNTIVASLHLYPGYEVAVLKLYGDKQANLNVLEKVSQAIRIYLPRFKLEVVYVHR